MQAKLRFDSSDDESQQPRPLSRLAQAMAQPALSEEEEAAYQQSLFGAQWQHLPPQALPSFLGHSAVRVINTPTHRQWFLPRLTPAHAQELLDIRHPGQRRVRPDHVRALREMMNAQRWKNTAAPFALLTTHGYQADGQHRLHALAKASVPCLEDVSVAQMLDDTALSYVDTGSKGRQPGDVMSMMGHSRVHNSVIAAINFEQLNFTYQKSSIIPASERAQLVMRCPYLAELCAMRHAGRRMSVGSGPLAAALRCMRIDRDQAVAFFGAAFSNEHEVNGMPAPQAKVLTNYLLSHAQPRHRHAHQHSPVEQAAATIKAWNAWRRGKAITGRIRVDQAFFPEPV